MDDLYNAPPRLSDLKGDELRTALFERHERAKQEWLATRTPKSLFQRIRDALPLAGAA